VVEQLICNHQVVSSNLTLGSIFTTSTIPRKARHPSMQDPEFVHGAFAKIADRYVATNHVLSLGTDILWRRKVARMIRDLSPRPQSLLDLATGSGDLAMEIGKACPELKMTGADFCAPMLDHARKRQVPNLELLVADALDLPFADASFDIVTAAFGLRNMADWPKAAQSMARVVKPGGHLLVLDFSLPTLPLVRPLYRFYLHNIMPAVAGLMTGQGPAYKYLAGSIEKFPSGASMEQMLKENGFATAVTTPLNLGIASIYLAKK
jgi:demethylmenaquinone methyltransferase / 2-methoxy-6-polyprenyl-1,4-benzoquinol methylase